MNNAERKINGLSALGVIRKIVKGRAIVEIQNGVFTPLIKWAVIAAGEVNSQRVPSIGEQVILLNVCGGDDLSGMIIVGYLHSAKYPAPHNEVNTISLNAGEYGSHITTNGDKKEIGNSYNGTFDKINTESSSYVIKSKKMTIDSPVIITETLKVKKDVFDKSGSMTQIRMTYNGHNHTTPAGDSSSPLQYMSL